MFAFVAAAADFTGVWSGKADITANGEQQPSTAQLNLKQNGTTVTGTGSRIPSNSIPSRMAKLTAIPSNSTFSPVMMLH